TIYRRHTTIGPEPGACDRQGNPGVRLITNYSKLWRPRARPQFGPPRNSTGAQLQLGLRLGSSGHRSFHTGLLARSGASRLQKMPRTPPAAVGGSKTKRDYLSLLDANLVALVSGMASLVRTCFFFQRYNGRRALPLNPSAAWGLADASPSARRGLLFRAIPPA
ncbi:MAG: hypothetical protein JWR77_2662, partial [Rhizorhabdus sp.]|nr:hypothetical protein [Rhizorhabdus sp.]